MQTAWAELSYIKSNPLIFHIKKTWGSELEWNEAMKLVAESWVTFCKASGLASQLHSSKKIY